MRRLRKVWGLLGMSFESELDEQTQRTNWNSTNLGNICKIKGGKRLLKGTTLITIPNKHPYIKIKDMPSSKYVRLTTDFEYVDDATQKTISRYIVHTDDVIISIVGTIGLVSKVDRSLNEANLTENCVKLTELKDITSDFLYYYLSSNIGQDEFRKGTVGSTQPKLPIYNIEKIQIQLPPQPIQKQIATILSALDDKIELYNRMNKVLEQMAQAIFKQWFVDFEFLNENDEPYKSSGGEMVESELGMIPKGWRLGKITDIAEILMGQSPKSEFYNTNGGGMPFHQGVANYGYRFPSHNIYCTQLLRIAKQGSVLISVRAPVGRLNIADCDLVIGRGLGALNSKNNHNSYLLAFLQKVFAIEDQYGSGTIFNSISKKELEEIKIVVPSLELMQSYDKIAANFNDKIANQCKTISILINLRDTLLPKLMSGEIDVSQVEL
jgi:type I restriction enzyme S subunit